MSLNHCNKCNTDFPNPNGADAFIRHVCDPDAVRREGMRNDILIKAGIARMESLYTTSNHADDLRRFASECREFAEELSR
jgi:hypothetical protein